MRCVVAPNSRVKDIFGEEMLNQGLWYLIYLETDTVEIKEDDEVEFIFFDGIERLVKVKTILPMTMFIQNRNRECYCLSIND